MKKRERAPELIDETLDKLSRLTVDETVQDLDLIDEGYEGSDDQEMSSRCRRWEDPHHFTRMLWHGSKYRQFIEGMHYDYVELEYLITEVWSKGDLDICGEISCDVYFQDLTLTEILLQHGANPDPMIQKCLERDHAELLDLCYCYSGPAKREHYEYCITNEKKKCIRYYKKMEWF